MSDTQELQDEITQLERARDSADTERECFAVRKAKEADEWREEITKLKIKLKRLVDVGHNLDCLFCGLKDKIAMEGKICVCEWTKEDPIHAPHCPLYVEVDPQHQESIKGPGKT